MVDAQFAGADDLDGVVDGRGSSSGAQIDTMRHSGL